jgi:hypothetical protein
MLTPGDRKLPTQDLQPWNCEMPAFRNLHREPGENVPRPKPCAPSPPGIEDATGDKLHKAAKKRNKTPL